MEVSADALRESREIDLGDARDLRPCTPRSGPVSCFPRESGILLRSGAMGLLVDDLKQRRIVRVAIRYLLTVVAGLLALGVLDAWLAFPEWAIRLAAGGAFTALPFVLVMIWALDDHGPEKVKVARRR